MLPLSANSASFIGKFCSTNCNRAIYQVTKLVREGCWSLEQKHGRSSNQRHQYSWTWESSSPPWYCPEFSNVSIALMCWHRLGTSVLSIHHCVVCQWHHKLLKLTSLLYKHAIPNKRLTVTQSNTNRVSATADRPARRRSSAHAKYSVSHHMVIKPFTLLGLNTDLDGGCDQQLSDDHQKFMTLTSKLSWQRLRRSAVPEIWLVPTQI